MRQWLQAAARSLSAPHIYRRRLAAPWPQLKDFACQICARPSWCGRRQAATQANPTDLWTQEHSRDWTSTDDRGDDLLRHVEAQTARDGQSDPAGHGKEGMQAQGPKDGKIDFSWIRFQSAVESEKGAGTRLVDHPSHMHDLRLWRIILEYRYRVDHAKGVYAVWTALRGREIVLPTSGAEADRIWHVLLNGASRDEALLRDVLEYATAQHHRSSTVWPFLLETLTVYTLRRRSKGRHGLHERLKGLGSAPDGHLARMVLALPSDPKTLEALRVIYTHSSVRNLYATIVPLLHRRGRRTAASKWHWFLTSYGDVPRDPVREFQHPPADVAPEQRGRAVAGPSSAGPQPAARPTEQEDGEPDVQRTGGGIVNVFMELVSQPGKPLSDRFCARYFATTAVSVNVILGGMQMLGVETLGPLALRELAVREGDPEALAARIKSMRRMGIGLDSSKFSRLVQQFAFEGKAQLLEDLIMSDQHPDELDNVDLQRSLLAHYLAEHDVRQVRKTLAVLTAFEEKDVTTLEYNHLLQACLARGAITKAVLTLDMMHEANIPVTATSARVVAEHQLTRETWRRLPFRQRQRHRARPAAIPILLHLLQSGSDLEPRMWGVMIRRLRFARELVELERLALWLAAYYGTGQNSQTRNALVPARIIMATSSRRPGFEHMTMQQQTTGASPYPLQRIFYSKLLSRLIELDFELTLRMLQRASLKPDRRVQYGRVIAAKPWIHALRLIETLVGKGLIVKRSSLANAYLVHLEMFQRNLAPPGRADFGRRPRFRPLRISDAQIAVMKMDARRILSKIEPRKPTDQAPRAGRGR